MNNKAKYLLMGNAESPHLIKWARELAKHVDLYVLSFQETDKAIYQLIEKEKCYSFHQKINTAGGNFHLLKLLPKVKRIIKEIKPDFINAHYITSYGFLAALVKPGYSKLILSAWGSDILVTPFESNLKKKITQYALKKSFLVTSDSNFMSEKIRVLSPKAHILTFPFGLEKMPECSIENKNPTLFFSNRALTPNYRIELVLELFSEICTTMPESRLIIANEGSEKEKLMKIAAELGISNNIEWVGFINAERQAEIYKKATYFFSVPISDATSVSLLEAMAYGCVPIVSDIPANHEWIKHLENGIFIQNNTNIIEYLKNTNHSHVFDLNRKIIKERAIFSENILGFIKSLFVIV
ncbi:MAG TPA: glycosyltransferase [Bacteroidales bacterium]|jgi:glycosyltransferase involved in cell wall biosynthesis|nr:glycosyltransferase family 4 protein [Bacteroidales bacterium]HNV95692.1 glycosyltransferase [Bacteroidales bacterium]